MQLVFPIVFVGIALYIYRSNHALLVGFREQLAVSPKGRRFVVLTALLALLIYHFVALCGSANPLQLLLSSILAFTLFSQRFGERIIRFFQDRCWGFFIFVVALAGFFMPMMAPLAVTLTVLLIASWIYPTEELMHEVSERGDTSDIIEETIEGLNGGLGLDYMLPILKKRRSPMTTEMRHPMQMTVKHSWMNMCKRIWTMLQLLQGSLLKRLSATGRTARRSVSTNASGQSGKQDVQKMDADCSDRGAFPSAYDSQMRLLPYVELFTVEQ